MAPAMTMHGRIEDIASARRHERMYARTKPVMNEAMKLTVSATFSDIPCWTRSTEGKTCLENGMNPISGI